MTKKQIKKLLSGINNVTDLEDKRKICQEFGDMIHAGIQFKLLADEEIEKSFEQVKVAISNVRYS